MDIKRLKQYIFANEKIEYILHQIGCKNIARHDNYYTCSNYDGDNTKAICQYFDSEYLNCINYTRDIRYNKQSDNQTSIIDLVCYNKQFNLFQCIKYLCDILGLDYYAMENEDDVPESLKMLQMLYDMKSGDYVEENTKLKPISENVLSYYKPYVNDMFANDNISYATQKYFEIGYDDETNHITIPIRDELGNLVGVKGRVFEYGDIENKYIYLEKCARSKILYGLDKSLKHIKEKGYCYIGESEKFCLQLFNMGYYNCVSTGGKKISRIQKNKLMSLGVDLIFCFDKDVTKEEIESITYDFEGVNVYMMNDNKNILSEKESPSDNQESWKLLVKECILQIRKGDVKNEV
jgi:DNA primase